MKEQGLLIIAVALGSALGGVLRLLVREYLPLVFRVDFPVATLSVNVIGCLVAGLLYSAWQESIISPHLRGAVLVGVLGAFTTFSAMSLDMLVMVEQKQHWKAAINLLLNVGLSVIAVFFGAWIGAKIAT